MTSHCLIFVVFEYIKLLGCQLRVSVFSLILIADTPKSLLLRLLFHQYIFLSHLNSYLSPLSKVLLSICYPLFLSSLSFVLFGAAPFFISKHE